MDKEIEMSKTNFLGFAVLTLLFIGCSEKNIMKESEGRANYGDANRTLVINKSLQECAEHNILLDRTRTRNFMQRTPQNKINQALKNKDKTSKKLCQFFEQETSLEKLKKADELASRILVSCEKVGVRLSEQGIKERVLGFRLFVIDEGLKVKSNSTVQECELMQKRYR